MKLPVFIPARGKNRIEFENYCHLGKLDGEKAWSNGFVMFTGPLPDPPPSAKKNEDPVSWAYALKGAAFDSDMPEIHPVALFTFEGKPCVWFSNGKTVVYVNFWAEAYLRFSGCTFHCDGIDRHGVVVKQGTRRVGLIMALKAPEQWPAEVLEVLNAESQAART